MFYTKVFKSAKLQIKMFKKIAKVCLFLYALNATYNLASATVNGYYSITKENKASGLENSVVVDNNKLDIEILKESIEGYDQVKRDKEQKENSFLIRNLEKESEVHQCKIRRNLWKAATIVYDGGNDCLKI